MQQKYIAQFSYLIKLSFEQSDCKPYKSLFDNETDTYANID